MERDTIEDAINDIIPILDPLSNEDAAEVLKHLGHHLRNRLALIERRNQAGYEDPGDPHYGREW